MAWTVRAAKAARGIDDVWLAIPTGDRPLAEIAVKNGIPCCCGPEDDVLQRFKETAFAAKAEVVVRLTADCPFLDPALIDECVERRADTTEFWPDGLDVQVFLPHMLEHGDREHVVSPQWVRNQLPCPAGNLRHVRLTLDAPADYEKLSDLALLLPSNRAPTWKETLDALCRIERATGTVEEADPAGGADVLESA